MTLRKVTARPVQTYVGNGPSKMTRGPNRAGQALGVLQQLGVNMERGRRAQLKEDTAEINATANNKARALAAEYMPSIDAAMQRPETYEQTSEEFMQSDTFQGAYKSLEATIPYKRHRKQFKDNYQAMMLKRFADGKSRHEYQKLGREAAIAQSSGSKLSGIKGQMDAYQDALTSGVKEDEAFTSGLAVAILNGSEYLSEFAGAKTWTPKQELQIAKAKASLSKKDTSEASVAYNLAGKEQDRTAQYNAYGNVLLTFSDSLSKEKIANAQTQMILGKEEIETEEIVRSNLGLISVKDMAEGRGLNGSRKIPLSDMKEIQNKEVWSAIQNKDVQRLTQLTMIPGDEPRALKEVFTQLIGSLEQVNPEDPKALQGIMEYADFVKGNLGTERVRALISPKEYTLYQMLDGMSDLEGLPSAVIKTQEFLQLTASGNVPTPEDWNPREVVDHAVTNLEDKTLGVYGGNDVSRADVQALIQPYFPYWKALSLSPSEQEDRVDQLIKQSSWKGMLNGKILHDSLLSLTNSEGGNPYSEDPEELLDVFKATALRGIQRTQDGVAGISISVSPADPSILIMRDTGDTGIPINNGLIHLDDVLKVLKATVQTRKEKIEDERN